MLSRTDISMLSALIVVTLSSVWFHYQQRIDHPQKLVDVPEIHFPEIIPEQGEVPQGITVPDFVRIVDINERKSTFFDFMKPLVEEENQQILANRQLVLDLSNKRALSDNEELFLMDMAKRYGISDSNKIEHSFFEALLARIDIIPVSLALVQAANESGWGTSRFALEGNNFFGQWCFTRGCGIVPGSRPEGQTYEVRKFEDVAASVRSYIHNLNTHFQYEGMRELRRNRRLKGEPVTGPELARGLHGYSTRGVDYVEELLSMIASNGLLRYDLL